MRRMAISLLTLIILIVVTAGGALMWAVGIMDGLYAYRSPLTANPPEPGPSWSDPLTRRLVFVLIDALREDTSRSPEIMPTLNGLREQGSWAIMHSRPPSYSVPGYATLLTGAWPDLNTAPVINLEYENLPTISLDTLFSAADRAGLRTAVSGYYWFEKLVPAQVIDASFFTPGEDQNADRAVVNAALQWLQSGEYQLVLIHIDQVDYAGHHQGGPRDLRWNQAAQRADVLLSQITAALDLEKDTIFVCSDHGQIDRGGHGGDEPVTLREPFVLAGAGIQPGVYADVQMVDVAPTLAAILGAGLPAGSQGQVLETMLALTPPAAAALPQATAIQQSALLHAYQAAIGEVAAEPEWEDLPSPEQVVEAYQALMDQLRLARLQQERLPRLVVAIAILMVPSAIVWRRRTVTTRWLLGGGVMYLLLFNARYALLDGRTYSLSSVESAEGFIGYVALTALLGFGITWLVVAWGTQLFDNGPGNAAELTLGMTLATIYLLDVFVLWSFVMNGYRITWTLPDMHSIFLAFLALVQIGAVGVIGLVFSGLSGLVALWWRGRSSRSF